MRDNAHYYALSCIFMHYLTFSCIICQNYRLQWRRGRGRTQTRRNAFLEFQYYWNAVLLDERGKCGCGYSIVHKIHSFAKRRILLQDMVLRIQTLRGEMNNEEIIKHLSDNLYTYCDLQQNLFVYILLPQSCFFVCWKNWTHFFFVYFDTHFTLILYLLLVKNSSFHLISLFLQCNRIQYNVA